MGDSGSPQVIPTDTGVNATVVDGTLASYLGKDHISILHSVVRSVGLMRV